MTGTPFAYFEQMYAADPDPWQFETSEYEHRKYQLTVASLPRLGYRSAFEPGCSVGVLSGLLAPRCDRLLATDVIPGAVQRAARRLAGHNHVRVETRRVPEQWPLGRFDLVVLSELCYYFDRPGLDDLIGRAVECLDPRGNLVAVHWRNPTNYPLTGDDVHRIIHSQQSLDRVVHHEEPSFRLDVWDRR